MGQVHDSLQTPGRDVGTEKHTKGTKGSLLKDAHPVTAASPLLVKVRELDCMLFM